MIEWARWATKEELNSFQAYLTKKRNQKDFFTSDWLVKNGKYFIDIHKTYPDDIVTLKIKEVEENNLVRKKQYLEELEQFNEYLDKKCLCGGNNVYIESIYGKFIGCDNFRESGFNHTRIRHPHLYQQDVQESLKYLEIRTNYLFLLKQMHDLPKDLKESVLCNYLLMNNQTLYADLEQRYNLTRDVKTKSDIRERIIKPILESKFDKVVYQKGIMLKIAFERPQLKRPDFICVKDKSCYIFEQKKNIENISITQTHLYLKALEYMIQKENKELSLKTAYIIEEGQTDIQNNIFNLKSLQDYEFN